MDPSVFQAPALNLHVLRSFLKCLLSEIKLSAHRMDLYIPAADRVSVISVALCCKSQPQKNLLYGVFVSPADDI